MVCRILVLLVVLSSSLHAQASKPDNDSSRVSAVSGQIWEVDTSQSQLTFSVRNLVGRAQGKFDVWSGALSIPAEGWDHAAVDVTIQASSINTENEDRDDHLRNEDFFEVEKYPTIVFKSASVKREGDSVTVAGNLTMKDVAK